MIGLREAFEEKNKAHFLPQLAEDIFSEKGWLKESLGLEFRSEQNQMALAVAQTWTTDSPLLFEAGTGVGKSLAYLVPAIIRSIETGRTCVVATHTISLQEQLKDNDLPLCKALFSAVPCLNKYASFNSALLVGRGNYLCTTRLSQAISTKADLFPTAEQDCLEQIAAWSNETTEGIVHELNPVPLPEVWDWVNADSGACNRRRCHPSNCFFQKARARLKKAHIIIVNHSLLFALMNAGARPYGDTPGILFPNDFVVLDEAHHVPVVATENLGHTVTRTGISRLLRRLYNSKGKKNRGLLVRHGSQADFKSVKAAHRESESFFIKLSRTLLIHKNVMRLREESWADGTLIAPLREVHERVSKLADGMEEGSARDEMLDQKARLQSYVTALLNCLHLSDEDHVYWIEKTGRRMTNIRLRAAPIDVAPILRELFYNRRVGVLLTSATLAEGADMESFKTRVGAEGQPAICVDSPFDYSRQMRIFVARDAPLPKSDQGRLDIEYLAETVLFCTERVSGGSLVLWTSYHDMNGVTEIIEPQLEASGRPFFLQARDGNRSELVRWFSEAGNGVLFGTASFWTGVDIPGPALSQVIITRLPFENPNHPMREAKCEWITSRGGNPFRDLTLPEAVVKFRQGVGRLIRKQTDYGTITILDSRLVLREYGRQFISVLPLKKWHTFDRNNRNRVFAPLESPPSE